MEIMIVVTLIVIVATALLVGLKPLTQIYKGQDSRRKSELAALQKVLEDFYNDKQCYPKPNEVCYNDTAEQLATSVVATPYHPNSPLSFPSPLRSPIAPKNYTYQVDPTTTCPTHYRIYTTLSNQSDPIIAQKCQYGCGPAPDFSYNYGVSSPNTSLEANPNLCTDATTLHFLNDAHNCNTCGGAANGEPPNPYEHCQVIVPGETYYTDEQCQVTCATQD